MWGVGMTREDAILCLKGMKNYARDTFTEQTDWQESLDIAIEALKRKPDIRLKALMKNLKDRDWEMFATYRIDEVEARGIIEAIENLEKIK